MLVSPFAERKVNNYEKEKFIFSEFDYCTEHMLRNSVFCLYRKRYRYIQIQ